MSTITESEKKRLQSLKEKRQAFKTKRQIIQQALSNLDKPTTNNKIIFDDDFNGQQISKERQKRNLFDNDDDNEDNKEDSLWNEDKFVVKKNKYKITTLGNDARFTLDERFAENNHEAMEIEVLKDPDDLQKEKEKQLNILENVLGAPLKVKNQEAKTAKKGLMIRYDPTKNGHCEYEVKFAQLETKEKSTKKKKREKLISEAEELLPKEVSKDTYYTVSNTLAESLKHKTEFSLLKTYGREENDIGTKDCEVSAMENNKDQKFRFNFNAKSAFKYDSSDNEDVNEVPNVEDHLIDKIKHDNHTNNQFENKDTLFFGDNDVRFNEAVKFFSIEAPSNYDFKNLRRELKMIVRSKIRNNEKKHQQWGKKRKIKRS